MSLKLGLRGLLVALVTAGVMLSASPITAAAQEPPPPGLPPAAPDAEAEPAVMVDDDPAAEPVVAIPDFAPPGLIDRTDDTASELDAALDPAAALLASLEVPELRDEYSRTYRTGDDGVYVTSTHADPINFEAADGTLRPIDTRLNFEAAGDETVLETRSTPVDLVIADDASTDELVSVSDGEVSIGFDLVGARGVEADVAPREVTYADVRPSTDLVIEPLASGVKETLVLASPSAPRVFDFPLHLDGLTAAVNDSGAVEYRDGDGELRAVTPSGWMRDASDRDWTGLGIVSRGVAYQLVGTDQAPVLRVSLDGRWLDDPEREFPVTVDPTTVTVMAGGDDTYASTGYTTTFDYSYDTELNTGTYDSGGHVRRAYIHFNGLNSYANKVIHSATLRLSMQKSYACNTTNSTADHWITEVKRVTTAWDGRGTAIRQWATRPSASTLIGTTNVSRGHATGCPGVTHVNFNALSAVQNWTAGTWANHGIEVKGKVETHNYSSKEFASTETANDPRITFEWSDPIPPAPATPTLIAPANGHATAGSTVTLQARNNDTRAAAIGFHVLDQADNLVAWLWCSNGAAQASGATCSATFTAPAGDAKYDWYAFAYIGGTAQGGYSNLTGERFFFIDRTAPAVTGLIGYPSGIDDSWRPWGSNWVVWNADDLSGVNANAYVWDQNPTTSVPTPGSPTLLPPGVCVHPSANPIDYYVAAPGFPTNCDLAAAGNAPDGTWYLHIKIRNKAGLWSPTVHVRHQFDRTPPTEPGSVTNTCVAPTAGGGPRLTLSWTPSADASAGLRGYSWAWNNSATTPADVVSTEGDSSTTSATSPALADGTWYFHLRALDNAVHWADNSSNASADRVFGPFTVSGGTVSGETDAERFLSLWIPRATSNEFSEEYQATPGYSPSILLEGFHSKPPLVQRALSDCLVNELLRLEPTEEGTPSGYVDALYDTYHDFVFNKDALSDFLDTAELVGLPGLDPPALPDLGDLSVVDGPNGGPNSLLGQGPLLTDDLLGGDVLFADDPVAAVNNAASGLSPASPAMPVLAQSLDGVAGALSSLGNGAPLLYELLGDVSYTLKVERFDALGNSLGEFEEPGYVFCLPTTLSSASGRTALPGTHDLRVNLCPDPSSFVNPASPLVTYELDALSPGVRVRVTATLAVTIVGQDAHLEIVTDASSTPHPVDLGGGAPPADFPCSRNSLVPTPADSGDGLCLELSSQGTDAANGSNQITSIASGEVNNLTIKLGRVDGSEVRPEGQVSIDHLPAAARHVIRLEAQQPSALNNDTAAATVEVTNAESSIANPGETLRVVQFSAAGQPANVLAVANLPDALDAVIEAVLVDGQPESLELSGTSQASPTTAFTLEQFDEDGFRTGRFRAADFAAAFDYIVQLLNDQSGTPVGLDLRTEFSSGAPVRGVIEVTDDQRGATIRAESLSTDTHLLATVDDPADPSHLELELTNAQQRSDQLVRVTQVPPDGAAVYLLIAAPSADVSGVVDPPVGQRLRWLNAPQTLTLIADIDSQASGDPSAVDLTFTGSSAPPGGLVELRERRGGEDVVLRVAEPGPQSHVRLELEGDFAQPDRVRVERTNSPSRSDAALQVAVVGGPGLRSSVVFAGSAADAGQLISGTPSDIELNATNVPGTAFAYELQTTPGPTALPSQALISGSTSPAGTSMDLRLADHRNGLELHQRSFPSTFTYELQTESDTSGAIRRAVISGDQPANNPNGLLEVSFADLKARVGGTTASFAYDVSIDGPIASPSAAQISIDQSGTNSALLFELANGITGTQGRAYLSVRNDTTTPGLVLLGRDADVRLAKVPADLDLTFSLEEGATTKAEIGVDLHGVDRPDAELRVLRDSGAQAQRVAVRGIAPQFALRAEVRGSFDDPDRQKLELYRTVAHATDVVQLVVSSAAGGDEQNIVLKGDPATPAPEVVTASDLDVSYSDTPEAVVIERTRCENFGATDGSCDDGARDGRERLGLEIHNYNLGATFADPGVPITNPAGRIAGDFLVDGVVSRRVVLRDLPASFHLRYKAPVANPGAEDNCLGDIDYGGSDSRLDLELRQPMSGGCFDNDEYTAATARQLIAKVTDVPSAGLSEAVLHRDGEADFATYIVDGTPQRIGKLDVTMPVPDWVSTFVNEVDPFDDVRCFYVGACLDINLSANPHFLDVRLQAEATELVSAEVRTNIGEGGEAKPNEDLDDLQDVVWERLPILGVKNVGYGDLNVKLTGEDDPSQENEVNIAVDCCLRGPKTARHRLNDHSLDGRPLSVAFYGWDVFSNGGQDRKYNRDPVELRDSVGEAVHSQFGTGDVPFDPRFIAYNELGENSFSVPAGYDTASPPIRVSYFVPSVDDIFFSSTTEDDGRKRWFAQHFAQLYQTNWYWEILLRKLPPDPHGLTSSP